MSDAPPGRPRHRAPTAFERTRLRTQASLSTALSRPVGTVLVLTGVVAASSGMAIGYDDAEASQPDESAVSASAGVSSDEDVSAERDVSPEVSRDALRTELARGRVSLDRRGAEPGVGGEATVDAVTDPREIAMSMLPEYGWDSSEFECLDQLWISESNWDHTATNPTSGAYGIPQALPADKMASAGADWRTNPATQIEWGLEYISLSYGTPCSANEFKIANNWY